MNYRIVGQDGKIYGPVAAEKIREWLAQGRIESRSPIFVEGAGDWTFVGLLPEFSPQASPPTLGSMRPDLTLAHKTNGFATAGFVCGLLSLFGFCPVPLPERGAARHLTHALTVSRNGRGHSFAFCGNDKEK